MTALCCHGVNKSFGPVVALDGFDLCIKSGALTALLGPSGCGKTTALRVMAGFERPDGGEVLVGEREVASPTAWVPPEKRRVGMVFQDWALFPHLDVMGNVAFGLPKGEHRRVREVLEMVSLDRFAERMPHELSGGQQQRVALARALAPRPAVVLLDEPFSNLDASLRGRLRAEVKQVLRAAEATAVFVTHDQEEALAIGDQLAVMSEGRILQTGAPHEVYRRPASRAVAELVGEANFLSGVVRSGRAHTAVGAVEAQGRCDGDVVVMVRPETVSLESGDGAGRIVDAEFYGHDQLVRARLEDGSSLDVRLLGPRPDLVIGSCVRVRLTAAPQLFDSGE